MAPISPEARAIRRGGGQWMSVGGGKLWTWYLSSCRLEQIVCYPSSVDGSLFPSHRPQLNRKGTQQLMKALEIIGHGSVDIRCEETWNRCRVST
jgi:hypothetical protein